jgi:glycerol-3-phosphate dehydrogenase subunit C
MATFAAPLANWASAKNNGLTRPLLEKTLGIDAKAELPKFVGRTFIAQDKRDAIVPNRDAPAFGHRKVALYATCFVNYNKPVTGMAARAVLNHIGVETRAAYPGCCGMPFLEQAELDRVAAQAVKVSKELCALVDQGYDIVTLTASCGWWDVRRCGKQRHRRAVTSSRTARLPQSISFSGPARSRRRTEKRSPFARRSIRSRSSPAPTA